VSKKHYPAGVGMTPSKTKLGRFIRARRLELDFKQIPLAERAGLSQARVSRLEIGKSEYLNDRQLEGLAQALQCHPEELRQRMPVRQIAQPKTELGKFVRSRRQELGLTPADLAKKIKITAQQAKYLELQRQGIGYGLVKPLAMALELDLSAFVQFVGSDRKQTESQLGQLVRRRRKELVISTEELAEKLDVSRQMVNQIELGKTSLSNSDDLIKQLAKILKLDVNVLQAVRPTPTRRREQIYSPNPLGVFLAAKRLELHWTQKELGERAETTRHVVSFVERGGSRPSPNLLNKLAKALGCGIPADLAQLARPRGRPRIL